MVKLKGARVDSTDDRRPAEATEAPERGGETLIVEDLETLRVLSDPLRMRMVELMGRGEWTVKQVAARLGISQTRLYHHISLLERHGLVRVTGSRMVSGIVERRYAAPATISVKAGLLGGGGEAAADAARSVDGLLATAFARVRREIEGAVGAGHVALEPDGRPGDRVLLALDDGYLTDGDAAGLKRRLEALGREFSALAGGGAVQPRADGGPAIGHYRLLIGFFRMADDSSTAAPDEAAAARADRRTAGSSDDSPAA